MHRLMKPASVGGAMMLPPHMMDSLLSDPNLRVTHGMPIAFISSCMEPESVAQTAARLMAAITSVYSAHTSE